MCLLDTYLTVAMERGGYPERPPVTCIDISQVAEKTLNFQVGLVFGGFSVQVVQF